MSATSTLPFQYGLPTGAGFDELLRADGTIRPYWRPFLDALHEMGPAKLARRWERARRLGHDIGIHAYGSLTDDPRLWELDAIPVLLTQAEWAVVCRGLQQRARLLNRMLRDLLGPRTLLERGIIPPAIVLSQPGFMRAYHGQSLPGECYLHFYAADVSRDADGTWTVVRDRTEAPSGAGYALENRMTISRMLPKTFQACHVNRLAPFFIALQETLMRLSPSHRDNPHVALLSGGSEDANYFEDAYLARYLGYTLVEGGDLTVRDSTVMLKTLGGLIPVDAILRRPNSADCDPLELNGDSTHGVGALMQSVRSSRVMVASALGSGLVEAPAMRPFLAAACKELLGESLELPCLPTWWCGQPASLDHVMRHADELVIGPAFRARGSRQLTWTPQHPPTRADIEKIQAFPEQFVARPPVIGSTVPIWKGGAIDAAKLTIRSFLAGDGRDYVAMQGGLARVTETGDAVNVHQHARERSKDVWILGDGPIQAISLLHQDQRPIVMQRGGAGLPSRVADNVFWLGRHVERAEACARLLRAIVLRLTSETELEAIPELPRMLRALAAQGQIEPGYAVEEIRDPLPRIEHVLPQSVFDETNSGSLRYAVNEILRVASQVRDRLSLDSWHIVQRLDQEFRPADVDRFELADVLDLVDSLIIDLSAFSGFVLESMTRSQAFRFLEIGRRLERSLQLVGVLKSTLVQTDPAVGPVLTALLEFADSLMTYRSRYLANVQLAPVLDLLLTDETNPRSLAFQLAKMTEQVDRLPRDQSVSKFSTEQRLAMSALHTVRMVDVETLAELHRLGEQNHLEKLLLGIENQLPKLSEAIAHRYLIHVGPVRQLSSLRPI